jgi:hypothetical protein
VKKVPMPPRHLFGHDAEVLAPFRNVVRGDGGGRGGGGRGEDQDRGQESEHA